MALPGPRPKRKEVVWSEKLAYAVGLLVTDGCLSRDGRHIDLTSNDRQQLENFMYCIDREIRISTKPSTYTKKEVTRVQFSDVVLYDFLTGIGLTPNKTKTIGAVSIPDEYFFDFLRGHHDGDGSFYSYFDPRWKSSFVFYLAFISASEKHVSWLHDSIRRLCGVEGHRTFSGREGHKIHGIRYAKKETVKVLERMYHNPKVTCLSRKRLKIEEALRIVGKSLSKA
jgi:hypothetical protein